MQALMTEELAEGLSPLYATEGEGDPVALVHCFSCLNGRDWYLTEYDPATGEAFGLVRGFETEWGCFSVREMEELNRSAASTPSSATSASSPLPPARSREGGSDGGSRVRDQLGRAREAFDMRGPL